jgi:hypothetical protein
VDEDHVGRLRGKRLKAGANRFLARCPASDGAGVLKPADRLVEDGDVVWIQDRLHCRYFRMAAKWLHGAENHGLSAYRTKLFGPTGSGTKAASGCDEDGGGPFRIRHGFDYGQWQGRTFSAGG